MRKAEVQGVQKLKDMMSALKRRDEYLMSLHNKVYDANQDNGIKEDRLFPDDESALWARQNPAFESHYQKMKDDLDKIIGIWKKR